MAEPNSTGAFFDTLLTRCSVSGNDPYTWPFTASFKKPASYTVDLSMGNQVARFIGVQASEISPSWTANECRWNVKVSALKSFLGAEIASIFTDTVPEETAQDSTGADTDDPSNILGPTRFPRDVHTLAEAARVDHRVEGLHMFLA